VPEPHPVQEVLQRLPAAPREGACEHCDYLPICGPYEEERVARRKQLEDEYREDVDLYKLAANLIVDDVVEPSELRANLIARFRAYASRKSTRPDRKHGVPPV